MVISDLAPVQAQEPDLSNAIYKAARQRMLSQRVSKVYLVTTVPVEAAIAGGEISKARSEFSAAMQSAKSTPDATARIKEELVLA